MEALSEQTLNRLVQSGYLSVDQAAQVQQAIAAGQPLREAVVGGRLVEEEVFTQASAAALGTPYVNLRDVTIPDEVLRIIPETTAREHQVVAFAQAPDALNVAMADPSDRQIVEFIRKKVDLPVAVHLASAQGIRDALRRYQGTLATELETIIKPATAPVAVTGAVDLGKEAEDLPIVQVTSTILKHAILQEASDVHIEPTEKNVVVRYRIDGILQETLTLPKHMQPGLVARVKVLSNLKIDEHRLPQDGRFKIETDDYRVAFRVSILPVFDGEKVVMRLLDESGRGLTLELLGMRADILAVFRRNIQKPHGMVLVTGPTGSGKTTTLYAAMQELNTPDVNISTVEDPIEYRMPKINQTQVNPRIGLTFANGLRSLVRQDPDIIMVGEIRDEETASLAVNAALTGHLVMTTLHTNSAAGALPRLMEMGVETFLVASTVNLLQAQRLVRQLCEECRKTVPFSEAAYADVERIVDVARVEEVVRREKRSAAGKGLRDCKLYEPVGCKLCRGGYKGRTGIYEVIEMTDALRQLVSRQVTALDLENAARKQQGMITMLEDGVLKAVAGVTSLEEVLRAARE